MTNSVPSIVGLTNWLVFWLKAYLGVLGLSMLLGIWSHFVPGGMVCNQATIGTVAFLMQDAEIAVNDEVPADMPLVAEDDEDLANQDLPDGLQITLWDLLELTPELGIFFAVLTLWILTGVLFLAWVYRVVANLRILHGTQSGLSPLWAVCCYFIPVVNMFEPPRVMGKIWAVVSGSGQKSLVPGWWGLIIVQWILSRIDDRLLRQAFRRGDGLQHLFSNLNFLLELAGYLLAALVALYTLLMVQQIAREYQRHLAPENAVA